MNLHKRYGAQCIHTLRHVNGNSLMRYYGMKQKKKNRSLPLPKPKTMRASSKLRKFNPKRDLPSPIPNPTMVGDGEGTTQNAFIIEKSDDTMTKEEQVAFSKMQHFVNEGLLLRASKLMANSNKLTTKTVDLLLGAYADRGLVNEMQLVYPSLYRRNRLDISLDSVHQVIRCYQNAGNHKNAIGIYTLHYNHFMEREDSSESLATAGDRLEAIMVGKNVQEEEKQRHESKSKFPETKESIEILFHSLSSIGDLRNVIRYYLEYPEWVPRHLYIRSYRQAMENQFRDHYLKKSKPNHDVEDTISFKFRECLNIISDWLRMEERFESLDVILELLPIFEFYQGPNDEQFPLYNDMETVLRACWPSQPRSRALNVLTCSEEDTKALLIQLFRLYGFPKRMASQLSHDYMTTYWDSYLQLLGDYIGAMRQAHEANPKVPLHALPSMDIKLQSIEEELFVRDQFWTLDYLLEHVKNCMPLYDIVRPSNFAQLGNNDLLHQNSKTLKPLPKVKYPTPSHTPEDSNNTSSSNEDSKHQPSIKTKSFNFKSPKKYKKSYNQNKPYRKSDSSRQSRPYNDTDSHNKSYRKSDSENTSKKYAFQSYKKTSKPYNRTEKSKSYHKKRW